MLGGDRTVWIWNQFRPFASANALEILPSQGIARYTSTLAIGDDTIDFYYGDGQAHAPSLNLSGTDRFHMTAFTTDARFELALVDQVTLQFDDCTAGISVGCNALPPRTLTFGPLEFLPADATPALRRTWGALKAAYR